MNHPDGKVSGQPRKRGALALSTTCHMSHCCLIVEYSVIRLRTQVWVRSMLSVIKWANRLQGNSVEHHASLVYGTWSGARVLVLNIEPASR
jgi:hypothetical protein